MLPPREQSQPRDKAVWHGLTPGDVAIVFALNSTGPTIEGIGVIENRCAENNLYWVKFIGEPTARLRFVNPDWQAEPERSLKLLRNFWRSQSEREPVIEDFFPD